MTPEHITATAKVVTALSPIVGAILVWDIRRRVVANAIAKKLSAKKADWSVENHRFFLYCILIFVTAGATTALIGAIDSYYYNNYEVRPESEYYKSRMYFQKDVCWCVGNLTILVMVVFRLFKSKSTS